MKARALGLALATFLMLGGVAQAMIVRTRTAVNYRPYHPVARAAVATAAVVGTAAVIGSVVHSVPPSCTVTMVGNVTYHQCGSTWYEPRYAGSEVTYIVVNPPR